MGAKQVSKIKNAMGKLNSAYRRGLTPYPRTEMDYLEKRMDDYSPHPKLVEFADFCHSLNFSEYNLTMGTVPLELTNQRICTPATMIANTVKIGDFFEEREGMLYPIRERVDELEYKLSTFYSHLEDMKTKYGDSVCNEDGTISIDKITKDGAVAKRNPNILVYKIKLEPSPSREEEVKKYEGRKKKRDNVANFEKKDNTQIVSFSYKLLLEEYHQKKKMLDYLLRKRNREYLLEKVEQEKIIKEKTSITSSIKVKR